MSRAFGPRPPGIPPETEEEWKNLVKRHYQGSAPPLHQVTWTGGASHVSDKNFLSLRVIWPKVADVEAQMNEDMLQKIGIFRRYKAVEAWLNEFPPFQDYLKQCRRNGKTEAWKRGDSSKAAFGLGAMDVPRQLQATLISHIQDRPPIVDEETVLSSLISFLGAVTMRHPDVKCVALPVKKEFSAKFGASNLIAKVDGWLYEIKTKQVRALIETKRASQPSRPPSVPKQQSAEIVAFLRAHNPTPSSPFFIFSQEGLNIYLIAVQFTGNYLAYVSGNRAQRDFLSMRRFGPWSIQRADDLDKVAKLALAVATLGRQ